MYNKPHWQQKHEWWIEDFTFLKELKDDMVLLIRKNPDLDDSIGNMLRGVVKDVESAISRKKKVYKKIYGVNFNMRMLGG